MRCCTARLHCCAGSPPPSRSRTSTRWRRRTRRSAGSTSGTISTARSSAATAAGRSSGTTAGSATISRAVSDYGRLLASIGINGISINNVNANPLVPLARVRAADCAHRRGAAAMGRAGSRSLSISAAPDARQSADLRPARSSRCRRGGRPGGCALRARSRTLAGFVLKADSEGRVGPSTYGRTHADAANVVARALKPHGGVIFYRGFVYDHHMDWNNPKNDRARAAYDNFHPLDGAVRRQRHHPDQARADRFPGARTGVAALRRARENQPGDRAADHTGVFRPGAAHGLPRADVEGGARFRHAGPRRRHAGQGARRRQDVPPPGGRIRRRLERRARR